MLRLVCRALVHLLPRDLVREHGPEIRRDIERRIGDGRGLATVMDVAAAIVRERRRDTLRLPPPSPRRASFMTHLPHDLRLGLRMLMRRPGFALTAILTLGLGIGSATAIVSLADATLLRPLPAHRPEQLVELPWSASYPDFRAMQKGIDGFQGFTGYSSVGGMSLEVDGATRRVPATLAGGNYFELLGVGAHRGRMLTAADDRGGANPSVVISHRLWKAAFNGAERAVGAAIRINGRPATIVGVAPADFRGLSLANVGDLWIPIASTPDIGTGFLGRAAALSPALSWVRVVARMNAGETPAQASQRMDRWYAALHPPLGDREPLMVTPVATSIVSRESHGALTRFLALLFGVALLLLTLGCANVANLLLARAAERRQELGVRVALGAGRGRLIMQLMAESIVIAVAGAIAGLAISIAGLQWLATYRLPGELPIGDLGLRLNGLAIAAAITLAMAAVLLCGFLPALRLSRNDIASNVRQGGRTSTRTPLGRSLVAVQVALCVAMVGGGLLFARGLQRGLSFDLGYQPRDVAMISAEPTLVRYSRQAADTYVGNVLARIRAQEWVAAAGASMLRPMRGSMTTDVLPEGVQGLSADDFSINANFVTDGWFEAVRLPLREGRTFTEADRRSEARVVVVSESLAKKFWPGRSAVGARVKLGERTTDPSAEVIGVVADARYGAVDADAVPFAYMQLIQPAGTSFRGQVHFFVRSKAEPGSAIAALRTMLPETDPRVPTFGWMSLEEHVASVLMPQRLGLLLFVVFASAALVLAAAGVYAIAAYTVTARTREIGIRMALGAERGTVMGQILKDGAVPVLAGAAAGVAIQLVASRLAASFVFDLDARAPGQLAAAAVIVLAAAIAALFFPARRASRVDPAVALRQ